MKTGIKNLTLAWGDGEIKIDFVEQRYKIKDCSSAIWVDFKEMDAFINLLESARRECQKNR